MPRRRTDEDYYDEPYQPDQQSAVPRTTTLVSRQRRNDNTATSSAPAYESIEATARSIYESAVANSHPDTLPAPEPFECPRFDPPEAHYFDEVDHHCRNNVTQFSIPQGHYVNWYTHQRGGHLRRFWYDPDGRLRESTYWCYGYCESYGGYRYVLTGIDDDDFKRERMEQIRNRPLMEGELRQAGWNPGDVEDPVGSGKWKRSEGR